MAEEGLGGIFVTAPAEDISRTIGANRRYLSGFTGSMGHLLITPDKAFIAVDFRYYEQAERESPDFTLFQANGGMKTWLPKLIGEASLGGKKLGFESHGLTYATYRALRQAVDELPESDRPQLAPRTNLWSRPCGRSRSQEELDAIGRAVALGDAAFEHVAAQIKPGWTEKQVAWEIEKYARENGAERLSFPTIVGAGALGRDAARPAARPRHPGRRRRRHRHGRQPRRLHVRPHAHHRRRQAGREFKKIYDIVLAAQLTAEELIRSGMTGGEAHMIAARVIEEAGYGDNFGHGLGHGVGLQVHEIAARRPHLRGRAGGRHGAHRRAGHLPDRLGRHPHRGHGLPEGRQVRELHEGAEAPVHGLTTDRQRT